MTESRRVPVIAVVDPGGRVAELDTLNVMSALSPLPVSYHLPALFGMESLNQPELSTPAGLVILGSSASVTDGLPWQNSMNNWLKQKIEADVPTLGLCYGHQLIAHLYGAACTPAHKNGDKFRGFRNVRLTADRLWGEACAGPLVVSHKDMVGNCPAGFRIIAASDEVPIEGLAHLNRPVWSFQSHPEATPAFLINNGIPPARDSGDFDFGLGLVRQFLRFVAGRATPGDGPVRK